MTAFQVWLWMMLDSLVGLFGGLALIAGIGCLLRCMFRDIGRKKMWDWGCSALTATCVVMILLCAITPSTKQAAVIYALPKLANSGMVTNDIPEVYGMAIDALKAKLAEATESK